MAIINISRYTVKLMNQLSLVILNSGKTAEHRTMLVISVMIRDQSISQSINTFITRHGTEVRATVRIMPKQRGKHCILKI